MRRTKTEVKMDHILRLKDRGRSPEYCASLYGMDVDEVRAIFDATKKRIFSKYVPQLFNKGESHAERS